MQTRMTRGGGARGGRLHGAQRRHELSVRLGVVSVAMALSLWIPTPWTAGPAEAQSNEILLGTIETRDPRPPRDANRGQAAARMLDDAISALDSGEVMLGRRRLEALVQRYPETLAAGAAQQELERFAMDRRAVSSRYSEPQDPRSPPASRAQPPSESDRLGDSAPRDIQPSERQPRSLPARELPSNTAAPADSPASRDENQGHRHRLQDERRLQALAGDFQATAGERVNFGETAADLGSKARAVLVAQARWLAAHPDLPITIDAHADDQGSPQFNVAIAERRGRAVRDRLIAEGVAADRITVKAHGRDLPVATCGTSECAAQNRRVVTHIGNSSPEGAEDRSSATQSSAIAGGPGLERRIGRD